MRTAAGSAVEPCGAPGEGGLETHGAPGQPAPSAVGLKGCWRCVWSWAVGLRGYRESW